MFAVVRTGGKQYRVAAGDKIVVEKLAGEAGDTISLGDVLLAGEGSELKPTDGLTVSAEIIAQAKADKVIVFKKRRRHNYRRKKGHRQQHTILRIVAIGDQKQDKPKKAAKPEAPAAETAPAPAAETVAPKPKKAKAEAKPAAPVKSEPTASEMTDSPKGAGPKPAKKASTKKPAAGKDA
ncbi:MAG TPA: 50S ribosomal protein L21 [Allosphingosinicella sp.]|jgi:large subunit ribosomal protein L21